MDFEIDPEISLLDELKIQAQVLVPVLKTARAELGKEQADRLILGALRASRRELYKQIGAHFPGTPQEKMDAFDQMLFSRMHENDLQFEVLREDPEAVELNYTHCIFADFFRTLGEPELGAVLTCEADFQVVEEIGGGEVELTRTQTLMQGACCCDFRYRFKR
jgi:hypothetical protein